MIVVARKIDIQPWMKTPEIRKIFEILQGSAPPESPQALFVGGCVRNALLDKDVTDIDIATPLDPNTVIELLDLHDIKVIPTGIDHGTVTAIIGKNTFEITTLRSDIETDGRHAVVAFTDDWELDAARRDFTMNTLLADLDGNIYDPTGEGLDDLEAERVVFVGDAQTRIAEDYLRILRFFRFHALYGAGEPDPVALKACRNGTGGISGLSRERITQEFLKILAVEKAVYVLELMFKNNILSNVPHEKYNSGILGNSSDIIAKLVVLAAGQKDHMAVFGEYLILSNKQKKRFFAIIEAQGYLANVRELIYRYGADIAEQVLLLADAKADLSLVKNWQAPKLPVNGDDLIEAGIPSGPEIGTLLTKIERWWIAQDFLPDRTACMDKIKDSSFS